MTYTPPLGMVGRGVDLLPAARHVEDDEFDGSAIDTAGTRFTGATAWTAQNLSTSTSSQSKSCQLITPVSAAGDHLRGYEQAAPGSGAYKFTSRIGLNLLSATTEKDATLVVRNSSNSKAISTGVTFNSSTSIKITCQKWTNLDTFSSTALTVIIAGWFSWVYIQVEYDLTNLIFRFSLDGIAFQALLTETPATFLGAVPTHIGIFAECTGTVTPISTALFDYFRRDS